MLHANHSIRSRRPKTDGEVIGLIHIQSLRNDRVFSACATALFALTLWLLCCSVAVSQDDSDSGDDPATSTDEEPKAPPDFGDVAWDDLSLLDKGPHDILVLDEESENAKFYCESFDFPNRRVPTGVGGAQRLRFRLLDDSKNEYEVAWRHVVDIRLYEDMILDEANQMVRQGKMDEAYEYYDFLYVNYPNVANLKTSYDAYLYADAMKLRAAGQTDAAMAVVEELYSRNSSYRPSPDDPSAVDLLTELLNKMLAKFLDERDYRYANIVIDRVDARYGNALKNVTDQARARILADAVRHRDEALRFVSNGEGRSAHAAIRQMLNVKPDIEGGQELADRVMQQYPLVLVGVNQPARRYDATSLDDWAARRTGRMCYRNVVEFQGQGQDGGQYRFPQGRIEFGEDGKTIFFQLTQSGPVPGLPMTDAYHISKRIMSMADEQSTEYLPAWRRLLRQVEIEDAGRLRVDLSQAHVLPEAFLQLDFSEPVAEEGISPPTGLYAPAPSNDEGALFKPNPRYSDIEMSDHPEVVELTFSRAEDAVDALRRGDVDVIDRVYPSYVNRLKQEPGIAVSAYQLPTVHMLIPNLRNEHMKNPTFRLALLLGISRGAILQNTLLGGVLEDGFELVSGPFPIGVNDSDPLSYGYNFKVEPLDYDWRLASTIVLLAENQIKAMLARIDKKMPPRPKLVLAHPASDVAAAACAEIAKNWKLLEVETELRRLPPGKIRPDDDEWDLLYAEITMQEPVVDARKLLASDGIVGTTDSSVDLSLRQLDGAQSWAEARRRLNELHVFTHNDVIVIPLYQTLDYYAYRTNLRGVGRKLISLYDNVADWRIVSGIASDVAGN